MTIPAMSVAVPASEQLKTNMVVTLLNGSSLSKAVKPHASLVSARRQFETVSSQTGNNSLFSSLKLFEYPQNPG